MNASRHRQRQRQKTATKHSQRCYEIYGNVHILPSLFIYHFSAMFTVTAVESVLLLSYLERRKEKGNAKGRERERVREYHQAIERTHRVAIVC